jgi:hypothetical protein
MYTREASIELASWSRREMVSDFIRPRLQQQIHMLKVNSQEVKTER